METMKSGASIARQFRSYLPKERIRNIWETESGLAFIQRQRIESGFWEAPVPEPAGLYQVVILTIDCRATVRHNGRVRHSGFFPANTVQFVPPDAEVNCTGRGFLKFLSLQAGVPGKSPRIAVRQPRRRRAARPAVSRRYRPSVFGASL